jgi:hypothetical protein
MSCSRSILMHLLRGFGAIALIVLAVVYGGERLSLLLPLLIGAVVLMRGCPTCWLLGLAEAVKKGRESPHAGKAVPDQSSFQ